MTIDKQDAQHVLSFFDAPGGLGPGSFSKSLIRTYSMADMGNKQRLANVFPSMAAAFDLAATGSEGLAKLQEIAAKP